MAQGSPIIAFVVIAYCGILCGALSLRPSKLAVIADGSQSVSGVLSKPSSAPPSSPSSSPFDTPSRPQFNYPPTRTVNHTDDYHGIKVGDPYRWLEENIRNSTEVAQWVEAQNNLTSSFLDDGSETNSFLQRLKELYNYESHGCPFQHDFTRQISFSRVNGTQNFSVRYISDGVDETADVLLDPNTFLNDTTLQITRTALSRDGNLLAYTISEGGTDWTTIKILDVKTRTILPDQIEGLEDGAGADWAPDSKGFFYYPTRSVNSTAKYLASSTKLFTKYHRIGTRQDQDVVVYNRPEPDWDSYADTLNNGNFLILASRRVGGEENDLSVRDLSDQYAAPVQLFGVTNDTFSMVGNKGPFFYFMTDRQAPRRKLIRIDYRNASESNWKEIIPEKNDTMVNARLLDDMLILKYSKDVYSQLSMYDHNGQFIRDLPLPGIGTPSLCSSIGIDLFYSFTSFASPSQTYKYNKITGQLQQWRPNKLTFNADDFTTIQVFAPSKDGTKIPAFITLHKSMKRDGSNPTILYGYGGFGMSLSPAFSASEIAWAEKGGIWVTANLRGGSEYGEEWHKAGKKEKKQNVFDDFIAIAEYLIDQNYTSAQKLGITGSINGGLLVGAVVSQRPELFGAAQPSTGVLDMLRFNEYTLGEHWVDEYGSPKNATEFETLHKYSPYHVVLRNGQRSYPPMLIKTADTVDRVVPAHSFKFAAALQNAQSGDAPILIQVTQKQGHGRETHWQEWSKTLAFFSKILMGTSQRS